MPPIASRNPFPSTVKHQDASGHGSEYSESAAKSKSHSPNLVGSLSPSAKKLPTPSPKAQERRTFDNNLIWCLKVSGLDLGVTDSLFFNEYTHIGIVDAYILRSPQQYEQVPHKKITEDESNTGLLVFPDITLLNRFMVEHSADVFPDNKVEVVYLPSLERLKTPVGCTHMECRSLLGILLHSSYHTPTETAQIIRDIDDVKHAAQILCHSRFVSPGLATVIHRCRNIRSAVAEELLTTLFSDSSTDSYISDSMVLFGELHKKKYFSIEPVLTLKSILSQDILLTSKILRGLLVFTSKLHAHFEDQDTEPILAALKASTYVEDAHSLISELMLSLSSDKNRIAALPSPPAASPLESEALLRPLNDADAMSSLTDNPLVCLLPATAKQSCVACNGKAKFRCNQCEKHFCPECQKRDVQLHECLSRTVYVSKVDPNLSVKELRQIFDKFGTVAKVRLCGDPNQRGMYAFIEFTSAIAAKKMLQMDKQPFREGKGDTWRCLPARQPIHDHNDDDQVICGSKTHPCFFGIPKNMQNVESRTKTLGKSA